MEKIDLFEEFKTFEVDGSMILGGTITGCNQSGSTTTYDSTECGCGCIVHNNDSANMCDAWKFVQ